MDHNLIIENYINIKKNIERQAKEWNRPLPSLLAVSKYHSRDRVLPLLEYGHRSFGENIVQEAFDKWADLKHEYKDVKLHLIGHLQSNKVKDALQIFDVIETLDSEKLAVKIGKQLGYETLDQVRDGEVCSQEHGRLGEGGTGKLASVTKEFYVQVNIGQEEQKYGVDPSDVMEFVEFCRKEVGLNVTGLMAIPPQNENPSPYFAYLKHLAKKVSIEYISQGMSNDYQEAISVGSNEIRVGTAIFGSRV